MTQGKFNADGDVSGSAEGSKPDGQAELDVPMDKKPLFFRVSTSNYATTNSRANQTSDGGRTICRDDAGSSGI